jgi:hypothetical protein
MSNIPAPNEEPRVPVFLLNTLNSLVKHSLLITSSGMLISALLSSNPLRGIIYVLATIIAIAVRIGFLIITSYAGPENLTQDCESDLPGPLKFYDGGRNNIFILSFTLWYIALPMFLAKDMNWNMLFLMTVQLALSCFVLHGKRCISNYVVFLIEIIGGTIYGCIVAVILYYSGLRSWLMISGIPPEERAKQISQSLKCTVRKI